MAKGLELLEKQADILFQNIAGWETKALKRIGRRIKSMKSLSYADIKAINNATLVNQEVSAIMDELAILTRQNVNDVKTIYGDMIAQQHLENQKLYDYRGKPFVPFEDNKKLQSIVRTYARTTGESFVGLTMSKAKNIGFVDSNNKFTPIHKKFKSVLDKATMSIVTGTGDLNSEMREVLKELGGSGLRVDYGGGITRRLDTMVRQNLLWGAKQASVEYNNMIGEELGCDGIEIDWHSFPRPSHEFMQGKQYVLGKARTINGEYFESANDALNALEDYGCLHFKTPIICGISEPVHTSQELARLNEQNHKKIEIDGVSKTGYEWKQTMRKLETEARKTKDQMEILKASGDNTGARQLNEHLKAVKEKYTLVAEGSGIKAQPEKMAVIKSNKKIISGAKGTATIEGGADAKGETPKTIEQINQRATKGIERIVDERIDNEGLDLLKSGDISSNKTSPYVVDLTGIDAEKADTIVNTIEELSSKYKTTVQGYRTGKKGEFFGRTGVFATTEYNATTASSDIVFNEAKTNDVKRIKELSQKGWSVKLKEGFEDKYVATHEFAHTIIPNTTIPLKNYVGYDIKPQQSARRELNALFGEYKEKVQGLQRDFKQGEMDFIMGNASAGEKARLIKRQIDDIKISDYSLENVDEFMAEAFTSHEIGTVHTEYEKRVMDIIIKHFGKRGIK